jgi:hypothetical protein
MEGSPTDMYGTAPYLTDWPAGELLYLALTFDPGMMYRPTLNPVTMSNPDKCAMASHTSHADVCLICTARASLASLEGGVSLSRYCLLTISGSACR